MAKELPYFKFEPGQWENGNIQACSFEEQGVFINVCSMYWQRLGDLPYKLAMQKACKGNAIALQSLCDEGIIKVIDGKISIDFLNEQLSGFENVSDKNRENALKRWNKGTTDATALPPHSERNAIREEKRREEEIRVDKKKKEVPAFDEFLSYAKSLEIYKPEFDFQIKAKYQAWVENGWKDGNNKPIKIWKTKLMSTMPYFKAGVNGQPTKTFYDNRPN